MALDPVIHPPARLQLCAMLMPVDDAEFAFLRRTLDVSDSVLSKHAKALEGAGYLIISKRSTATRPRTWLSMTPAGREAFRTHLQTLQELAGVL